jgi:DNA-binding NarL/FixJ family response regulator
MRARKGKGSISVCLLAKHRLAASCLAASLRRVGIGCLYLGAELPHRPLRLGGAPVLVIDFASLPLPLGDVVAAARLLCKHPALPVIMIDDNCSLNHFLAAAALGVRGFLLHAEAETYLADAVRTVARGGAWLGPGLIQQLTRGSGIAAHDAAGEDRSLTPRERHVLCLLRQGFSNKEIAAALNRSVVTVKVHLSHVYAKLEVHDRRAALEIAASRGLLHVVHPDDGVEHSPPRHKVTKRSESDALAALCL